MDQSSNGNQQLGSVVPAQMIEEANEGKAAGLSSQTSDDQDHSNLNTADNRALEDEDDFELTFSLDQPRGSESPGQARHLFRSEEYRQLFHLPPEEMLIRDFNCALQKKILLQGHMYLFEHYVCFYSNIFGYEKKKVIILKDVTSLRKAKTAGLFPNAIEIVAWGKKNFFASFLVRDEAFRLIVEGWTRHSRFARALSCSQSMPRSYPGQLTPEQQDASFSESSYESRDIIDVIAERYECIEKHKKEVEKEMKNDSEINDLEIAELSDSTKAATCVCDMEGNKTAESVETAESVDTADAKWSALWAIKDEDAPNVPEHYKKVLEYEFPVQVQQFFELFFSNNAINFCESFHKKCGDEEFHCTDWAKDRHFGHVRDVSFRHPVKSYFGPKAAYCQEVQRYRVYCKSHLIIETSQQMNDIPYGDYFRVEGRWDVTPADVDNLHCLVRISIDVSFSKKTVWKGKIEQGTYDECREVFATWISEALTTLHEKGLVDDKNMKMNPQMQSFAHSMHSVPQSSKLKRKIEGNHYEGQGQRKFSKNIIIPATDAALKQEHEHHKPSSPSVSSPSRISHKPSVQESLMTFLTSSNQLKLVIAMYIMMAIILIQIGAIIVLTRVTQMQYVPVGIASAEGYHASFQRHCVKQDTEWLEQHAKFVQEEIALAEGLLQNIQYKISQLKLNTRLSETIHKDLESSL